MRRGQSISLEVVWKISLVWECPSSEETLGMWLEDMADMPAVNTEVEKRLTAWCCWTGRRSVMAIRLWQPAESIERTCEHMR